MSADSPRRSSGNASRGMMAVPAIVPPQVVSDRSILDSAIGFINEVTLAQQPPIDPKDTITWARFETAADISDPRFGDDWELEGNVAPPLLLILGYGLGVQVWAIPANGEAVEVLSWRHGIVSALRVLPTPVSTVAVEENGRADEPIDAFGEKRPLIALVDGSSTSGSQPQFCAVNFISLKTAAQVKTIKFKNPVIDILANRSSVVITFHERIAVFDARTLEDRLSITTCYPSPGINPNPAALGPRWLAYAENKLLHSKRSGGGCDGDGVASYTATVLNASKSLVKGLRELGEQVAAGLTGTTGSTSNSKNTSFDSGCGLETKQSGIVTIIDIKNPLRDCSPTSGLSTSNNQTAGTDSIIAHFIAHSEALVAMEFDNSGMLLVTADRRGHDFHVFRIQPNPVGSSLAAVHHLYILHRGDTSAKVQNITLTLDSRWVAVSTLRGTTHVFPITPYGGAMGVRTHTSLHVVNKLSRFHRSAGLSAEGRSNSPISHSESTTFTQSLQPYHNSTLPPFPRPTVVMPLAQLRQPFALGSPPGSSTLAGVKSVTGSSGSGSQRQRLSSLSDDSGKPLSVCAIFAKSRSWLLDPPNVTREAPHRIQRKAVDSLFIMAGHGALIQYDLDTKLASNVAKDKICDDTPIELEVEAKAQWNLGRRKEGSQEIMPPLSADNWLIKNRNSCMLTDSARQYDDSDDRSESWLAQVEIITHAGPHRRLWMGPQFVFKTYNTPSGSNLSHVEIEAVEIGTSKSSTNSTSEKIDHSSPLNMPLTATSRSSAVPVLIESGSYSSIEQSPKLMDRFRHDHLDSDFSVAHGDSRLKEDLADAMRESPSATASSKDSGCHGCETAGSSDNVAFFDALTAEDDHARSASAAALASVLPNIHSYDNSSSYESLDTLKMSKASIEKIVNPLGTVTTITSCLTADVKTDILDEVVSQLAAEDTIIHENCDESLFRPVVAIFCDEKAILQNKEEARKNNEQYQAPENISNKLVVPVIAKEVNDELNKREKEKISVTKYKAIVSKKSGKEQPKFEELSSLNKKTKEEEDNICEKIHNQNSKSTLLPEKNLSEIKKTCSKNQSVLKGNSSGIISSTKELQTQEKATLSLKTDKQPAESKKPDKASRSQIQQKGDFKMQTQKELENSDFAETKLEKQSNLKKMHEDSNLKDDLSKAEATTTKEKFRNLNSSEQNKEEHIRNTAKVSNDRVCHEYISEAITNVKFTANISTKADQIDVTENVMDIENFPNKSDANLKNNGNLTSQNLIKKNTATKEKINKTKGSIKTIKSGVNDTLITKPNDDHQPSDSLFEIKKNGKQIKATEKVKSMETENEKPGEIATNMALNNDPQSKDIVELQGTSETKKSHINIKNNDNPNSKNSVEATKSEKNKRVSNEENSTGIAISGNIKFEVLSYNKKAILDDISLNEEISDYDHQRTKSEYKDKSRKTKSDDNLLKSTISTDSTEILECDRQIDKAIETNKIITDHVKRENPSEIIIDPEKKENSNERNIEILHFKENEIKTEEELKKISKISEDSAKNEANDEINLKTVPVCKNSNPSKTSNELTPKRSLIQDLTNTHKEELCDTKQDNKSSSIETMNNAPAPTSPKKKGKAMSKDELKKGVGVNKKIPSDLGTYNKENSENPEKCIEKRDVFKEDNKYLKKKSIEKEFIENTLEVCGKQNKLVNKIQNPPLPMTSARKTLSGAEMISKNLGKSGDGNTKFPQLGTVSKINASDKLLPELPTPNDTEKQTRFDEFSILKTLDPLPPLPALEPLQLMSENKSSSLMDISLINFESPLQENPTLQRKITPAPRGFTEKNLILALCGSLHYENEHTIGSAENTDLSPAFSSNHSSAAFEEPSLADYKSLNENEDPYMSLEQSSQETNTTTTNTTNEKFSSSTYSSGSEEIVIMEEKKMTKKQKRKKQQQVKELQKQKEQQQHQEIDDEELRPLIAMTESHVDQTTNVSDDTLSASTAKCDSNQPLKTQPLLHSNTTDSEGPMPATTSDDNAFSIPVTTVHNQHKIKTKKLEHKINLIAAIEAATSSSTSSAEESGVELGGRSSHDIDESLISVASSISTSIIPLPIVTTPQTTVGALKKKTKRRKR
ncbi:uncharacterized protein LOC119603707 [Lucilia sericata]|uniref:uncharacterized protein LOC119603707 n=1 Tax=Lucilia sericata TaxID=13632 RepID=UPI0018A8442B|nr:uncharacterized protein LOC119603707 [Lucilia sericata]XP_037811765.1 uncharacterized protein LOC119603707 [Lucilia sericata]XP_037811767.1 uncharacterized protein LOC119603707 [Lucilia sericata]XP_037811768.1 uncharacterized protein LOC119603707 [Lucilia sericata]XP_037811769.1 uncharacterized protein LOC119603707 [Lucilia sericata]